MFFLLWNPLMQFDGMTTPILHFDSFIEAQYYFPQCSFLILTWFLRVNFHCVYELSISVCFGCKPEDSKLHCWVWAEKAKLSLSYLTPERHLKWLFESRRATTGHNSILRTLFSAVFVRVYYNDKLLKSIWFSQSTLHSYRTFVTW